MAEVQDIHRFSRYQKLIAFIGTDPTIYQSENDDEHERISKRGNKVLKKYCYLMATSSLRSNSILSEYYSKKIKQGFSHEKAMTATTNKLIRALYTLLIRGEKASI
jgi:transposase